MNELMIVLQSGDWMYFRTIKPDVSSAFTDFCERCESIGLNLDNVAIQSAVLRDRNGEDIGCLGKEEKLA